MRSMLSALLFLPLLTACQNPQADDRAGAQQAELARLSERVAALERQVAALQAAKPNVPTAETASEVTIKAAAQNCANDLSKALETYRSNSLTHRYPTEEGLKLEMPDSCVDQQVEWLHYSATAYAFRVLGSDGEEWAAQQGP